MIVIEEHKKDRKIIAISIIAICVSDEWQLFLILIPFYFYKVNKNFMKVKIKEGCMFKIEKNTLGNNKLIDMYLLEAILSISAITISNLSINTKSYLWLSL